MLSVLLTLVILSFAIRHSAHSAVIYSGLQNIPIATTFDGVYVDIDNGTTGTSTITGWDVNIFFGGVGIAGSTAFQPARISSSNESTVLKYQLNDVIGGSLIYSSGETGSSDHIGPGLTQFQDGVEGYIGFRFTKNDNSGPYYGWMRVTLTANTPGGVISDWAWEDSGGFILAGVPEPSRSVMVMLAVSAVMMRRSRRPRGKTADA